MTTKETTKDHKDKDDQRTDRPMQTQPIRGQMGIQGQSPDDPRKDPRTPAGPMFAEEENDPRGPIDPETGLRGRPEGPSNNFGQKTRDNVNPAIPSSDPGTGGIVDPASLGMEQGGTAPRYYTDEVPVRSINEPGAPMG